MHIRTLRKNTASGHAQRLCLRQALLPPDCERQPLRVGPRRVPFKYPWGEVTLASQNMGRKQHLGRISPKSQHAAEAARPGSFAPSGLREVAGATCAPSLPTSTASFGSGKQASRRQITCSRRAPSRYICPRVDRPSEANSADPTPPRPQRGPGPKRERRGFGGVPRNTRPAFCRPQRQTEIDCGR